MSLAGLNVGMASLLQNSVSLWTVIILNVKPQTTLTGANEEKEVEEFYHEPYEQERTFTSIFFLKLQHSQIKRELRGEIKYLSNSLCG